MSDASLIIQRPTTQASQLVLLFHGVGATPADMVGVGQHVAALDAKADRVAEWNRILAA